MNRDTFFLFVIAGMALCFGLANGIQFLLKKNRTARTAAAITSVSTTLPERTKFRNAKWAAVSYKVNGKTYQSQNRIQVSMAAQIGSVVTVRYDTQNPEKLYHFSVSRIVVSFLIAAVCIAAAVFHLV